ncbi:MAG: phospholipid/cholesterol/gamma-HCH transport system ATP-binding protein, partial [Myxococcota bacterium]
LAGLYTPDEGRVLVDGESLALMDPEQLAATRERYGYLFQNYALFDFMTVLDNVAFPARQLPGADQRESIIVKAATERLTEVGLGHALDRFPRELSGGMKKRVGLARATITNPQIALYDDPSAGLDPVTSSKIFDLVARMHGHVEHCASVVVSHDIDRLMPLCDRYLMLLHGQVIFDGTETDIETADPRVKRFFDVALTKHLAVP